MIPTRERHARNMIGVKLPLSLDAKVRQLAHEHGATLSDVMVEAVRRLVADLDARAGLPPSEDARRPRQAA